MLFQFQDIESLSISPFDINLRTAAESRRSRAKIENAQYLAPHRFWLIPTKMVLRESPNISKIQTSIFVSFRDELDAPAT